MPSIGTKIDDLGMDTLKLILSEFCVISQIPEATTAKRMKVPPIFSDRMWPTKCTFQLNVH